MLLASELALLAIDPDSGRHALGIRDSLNACMAGLLIAELTLDEDVERGAKQATVVPVDGAAPDSPVLAAALAVVAERGPKVKAILSSMSRGLDQRIGTGTWDSIIALLVDEVRLKDMDRQGIDIQAVSPAPQQTYYWTEPKMGAELARLVNERLAEIVAKWPERFVGLGTVPLQDPDMAVSELEYCVKKLGMRGVEINGSVNGMDLTDGRLGLDRFFAKVQELDVIIFMHPTGYTQGERLLDHYFNNVIGNPLETTVAASHLIFDGVMDRYPRLKVVLPHGSGFLAHYWERMNHGWKARPDCRTVIKKSPTSYLEKFYFDTIVFDPQMLDNLVRRYGADRIVMGTDYPFDMGVEDPVGFVARGKLSSVDKAKIMGGNAAAC